MAPVVSSRFVPILASGWVDDAHQGEAAGRRRRRPRAAVARLERKLEQREEVLARARERVGRQRAKTDDWKRKAAERWHEIGSLRSRVKQLERALADALDGAQPGPLPGRTVSGSRREPSAARRSDRAN